MAVLFIVGMTGNAEAAEPVQWFKTILQTGVIIDGDLLFDFNENKFMLGFAVPLLTIKDGLIDFRLQGAGDFKDILENRNLGDVTLLGAGFSLDLFEVIDTYIIDSDNALGLSPRVGLNAMADINSGIDGIRPVLSVSLIQKKF